jgi:serine protease Do
MLRGRNMSRISPVLMVVCLAAGTLLAAAAFSDAAPAGIPKNPSIEMGKPPFQEGADLADVAEGSVQGVVNISTTRVVPNRWSTPSNDPFFDYFFGRRGRGMPQEQRSSSLGSGVIVSKDGIVLTNNHVVEGAEDITVTLFDDREIEAEVVGADPKSDLAVIRLKGDSQNLHPIPLGDSGRLRLGETVLAIGNPFGLGHTVTSGIVSAKGRANMGIVDYEDFIQTDAAINPGNSGGALLNRRGQLVGINTAIFSRSGGYQGIGFAIPSNMAQDVLNSILSDGRVVRGWLGVAIQDIDKHLAESLGLDSEKGVLVADVTPDGPAEKAGLQRADVIVKVDDDKTHAAARLKNVVARKGAGTKVKVTLIRYGKEKTVTVKLGELPVEYTAGGGTAQQDGALAGLSVKELDASLKQEYKLPDKLNGGVVVTKVEPGSAAHAGGLREGDVILEVNKRPIDGVEAFLQAYDKNRKKVLLLVLRDGYTIYAVLRQ